MMAQIWVRLQVLMRVVAHKANSLKVVLRMVAHVPMGPKVVLRRVTHGRRV